MPGCPSRLLLHLDDAHTVVAVIHVPRELVVQPRLGLLQTVNPVGHAEPVHHTVLLRHQFSPFSKRSIVPNDTGLRSQASSPTWIWVVPRVEMCLRWCARCVCPCRSGIPLSGRRYSS